MQRVKRPFSVRRMALVLRMPGDAELRPICGRGGFAAVELDQVALRGLGVLRDEQAEPPAPARDRVLAKTREVLEGEEAGGRRRCIRYRAGRIVVATRAARGRGRRPRRSPGGPRLPLVPGGLRFALSVAVE